MTVDEMITMLKDRDDKVRTGAWLRAGEIGSSAVRPLAALMNDGELEIARAAKRGLWQIVRHTGRPGAEREEAAVVTELTGLLLDQQSLVVRREVLWMLSEIGGDESVDPVAGLLANRELREDARMVLQRIPSHKALVALQAGLVAAPEDFRPNIGQSLEARGVSVPGVSCRKLVPTKPTHVKPVTTRSA
jgi:HEAT repeat protein